MLVPRCGQEDKILNNSKSIAIKWFRYKFLWHFFSQKKTPLQVIWVMSIFQLYLITMFVCFNKYDLLLIPTCTFYMARKCTSLRPIYLNLWPCNESLPLLWRTHILYNLPIMQFYLVASVLLFYQIHSWQPPFPLKGCMFLQTVLISPVHLWLEVLGSCSVLLDLCTDSRIYKAPS